MPAIKGLLHSDLTKARQKAGQLRSHLRPDAQWFGVVEISRIAGVGWRVVDRWLKSGLLALRPGPAGQRRRVHRRDLFRLFITHGMEESLGRMGWAPKVVVTGPDPALAGLLSDCMTRPQVLQAPDLFEAGLLVARYEPVALIMDLVLDRQSQMRKSGALPCLLAAAQLRQERPWVRLVAVTGDDEEAEDAQIQRTFDAILTWPFDVGDLVAIITQ